MIETVSVQEVINFNEKLHSSSEEEYQYLNKRVVFVDTLKKELDVHRAEAIRNGNNSVLVYIDYLQHKLFGEATTGKEKGVESAKRLSELEYSDNIAEGSLPSASPDKSVVAPKNKNKCCGGLK